MLTPAVLAVTGCARKAPETGVFVDPALAPLIPADTTLILGVRVELLAKTPAFSKVADMDVINGFAQQAGIDAATRLWQVLLVSNGHRNLVLGKGKFTNGIIAPELARKGAGRFSYKGMNLFGDEQEAVLFLNSSTAVYGETPELRVVADQSQRGSGIPAGLAAMMKDIPHEAELWGVYGGGPVDLALRGNLANMNNVVRMLKSGWFYANFDTQAHLSASGVARDDASAQQLHDALQGLLALARINGQVTGQVNQEGRQVSVKADAPVDVFWK
jgi:hypothetical protein